MRLYSPPAAIDDFSRRPALASQMREKWHQRVSGYIEHTKNPQRDTPPSDLFFDQLKDDSGVQDPLPAPIPWNAFPRFLRRWFANEPAPEAERLANFWAGEPAVTNPEFPLFPLYKKNAQGAFDLIPITYRRQDEYCEWHVVRENNRIRRIYFTVEPPEYWEFLAQQDFSLVLELYRELLHDPSIPGTDLQWQHDVYRRVGKEQHELEYRAGDYNPWNVWNTRHGAIHLTHWANRLSQEVELASDVTLGWPVQSEPNGKVNGHTLICCYRYGSVNRSSDPIIGAGVFNLASQGLSVALADPIGVYILPFELPGLLDPDDNPIGDVGLTFVRKSPDSEKILRAEVAPPPGANYTLDQCTLDGKPLEYGGQIAQQIRIALFGIAKKIPGKVATPMPSCTNFCCTIPANSEYFGNFEQKPGLTCEQITREDWNKQLRDVPRDELTPSLRRLRELVSADAETFTSEEEVLMPVGRQLVPVKMLPSQ